MKKEKWFFVEGFIVCAETQEEANAKHIELEEGYDEAMAKEFGSNQD